MADIQIGDTKRLVNYDGSNGLGPYSFEFQILEDSDILVRMNDMDLELNIDYLVTIENAELGTGSVTIISPTDNVPETPNTNDVITLSGDRGISRATNFTPSGTLRADEFNLELNNILIIAQQIREQQERTPRYRLSDGEDVSEQLLYPSVNSRAGHMMGWDDLGRILAVTPTGDVEGIVQHADHFPTLANIASEIATVAGISDDVETVAEFSPALSANLDNFQTIIDNLATIVDAENQADAAAASAVDSAASAVASNLSAQAAADSALNALNTKNDVDALVSQAKLDHLGVHAIAPTVDNEGGPLVIGMHYFNSTDSLFYTYNGTSWVAGSFPAPQTEMRFTYTLTVAPLPSNELFGVDDLGNTPVFESDHVTVIRNGIQLPQTDYTVQQDPVNKIVFNALDVDTDFVVGDVIELITRDAFTLGDVLNASQGGTISGALTINASATFNQIVSFSNLALFETGSQVIMGDVNVNTAGTVGLTDNEFQLPQIETSQTEEAIIRGLSIEGKKLVDGTDVLDGDTIPVISLRSEHETDDLTFDNTQINHRVSFEVEVPSGAEPDVRAAIGLVRGIQHDDSILALSADGADVDVTTSSSRAYLDEKEFTVTRGNWREADPTFAQNPQVFGGAQGVRIGGHGDIRIECETPLVPMITLKKHSDPEDGLLLKEYISFLSPRAFQSVMSFWGNDENGTIYVGPHLQSDTIKIDNLGYYDKQGQAISNFNSLMPIGTVIDHAGPTNALIDDGWLFCDGAAHLISSFPDLHAMIGQHFGGAGNEFHVPDLRGRVVAGRDDMGNKGNAGELASAQIASTVVGSAGGNALHQLTVPEMPTHNHDYNEFRLTGGGLAVFSGSPRGILESQTENSGGDQPHNNIQPTIILNKFIKARHL